MNVISKTGGAVATETAAAPIARRLADFTADLGPAAVPGRIAERAKLHVLDCLGIALASTTFEFAQRAANAVRSLGGEGPYPAIGFDLALPVRDQALLNGVLIHGLDFDDTHTDGVIHASASALAAAMAQALRFDASGAEMLAAYLVGVETSARILHRTVTGE